MGVVRNIVMLDIILCVEILEMSQRTTKPTIKLVRPAKTQISLRIRVCHLQHPGYPRRDKRESLPYLVDAQADLSLYWLHCLIVGFVVR